MSLLSLLTSKLENLEKTTRISLIELSDFKFAVFQLPTINSVPTMNNVPSEKTALTLIPLDVIDLQTRINYDISLLDPQKI